MNTQRYLPHWIKSCIHLRTILARKINPTGTLTNLDPHDQAIGKFEVVKKRLVTDFEAPK